MLTVLIMEDFGRTLYKQTAISRQVSVLAFPCYMLRMNLLDFMISAIYAFLFFFSEIHKKYIHLGEESHNCQFPSKVSTFHNIYLCLLLSTCTIYAKLMKCLFSDRKGALQPVMGTNHFKMI